MWPVLLSLVTEVWQCKPQLTRDLDDRLYSRAAYAVSKTLYSLPGSAGVFLAYTVPAYLLAGIHYPDIADLNSFYIYLGYMILYLLCLQLLSVRYLSLQYTPAVHMTVRQPGAPVALPPPGRGPDRPPSHLPGPRLPLHHTQGRPAALGRLDQVSKTSQ